MRNALAAALAVLALAGAPRARAGAFRASAHGNEGVLPCGCGTCHVGHGPPQTTMLPDTQEITCLACHGNASARSSTWTQRLLKGSTTLANISAEFSKTSRHPLSSLGGAPRPAVAPRTVGRRSAAAVTTVTCSNCHNPHYLVKGNRAENLTQVRMIGDARGKSQPEYAVCYRCHGSGATVDISRLARQGNPSFHPVEAIGRNTDVPGLLQPYTAQSIIACTSCHAVHGSKVFDLLTGQYPATFYAPYTPKTYELCLGCHETGLVAQPETKNLTSFRNGTLNLHYLHVHNPVKGRRCRACHGMHAADQPDLIRASVPFGPSRWALPIQFTKTKTGGACFSGCHEPRACDRDKPIHYALEAEPAKEPEKSKEPEKGTGTEKGKEPETPKGP